MPEFEAMMVDDEDLHWLYLWSLRDKPPEILVLAHFAYAPVARGSARKLASPHNFSKTASPRSSWLPCLGACCSRLGAQASLASFKPESTAFQFWHFCQFRRFWQSLRRLSSPANPSLSFPQAVKTRVC